jgi:hypothetical protein
VLSASLVCLWCNAPLEVASAVCPRCDKRQADHPSMPSLDLPTGPARSSAPAAHELSAPAHGGGMMFDADDMGGSSDLETDSDWHKPARPLSVAPVAAPAPPSASGASGPRALPEPDPQEIAVFAAYDSAPGEWWAAPGYAYRVKMRQAVLGRQLAERRGLAAKAEEAEEEALAAFGERIKPTIRDLAAYAEVTRAVAAAEQVMRKEDSALAAEMDAHAAKLAAFDKKIAPLEHELAGAKADTTQLQTVFDRAEAMRKRTEIEGRNATPRTDAGKAAGPTPAELAAREQLTRATANATQAGERLAEAKKNASEIQRRIFDVKNERAAANAEQKRRGDQKAAGVSVARKAHRKAMAELADKALGDTATFGADYASDRDQIERLREALAKCARDVILGEKAMGAYDREVFKLGATIVAAVVGGLLLLCVIGFYYAAIGGATPAPSLPPPVPSE